MMSDEDPRQQIRHDLLTVFQAGVARVEGRAAVSRVLRGGAREASAVIAIGKAAESMFHGAQAVLGDDLLAGLIITKHGHGDPRRWAGTPVRYLESAHPILTNRASTPAVHCSISSQGNRPDVRCCF